MSQKQMGAILRVDDPLYQSKDLEPFATDMHQFGSRGFYEMSESKGNV